MQIEKVDNVTYTVNNQYEVFYSWRKEEWLCECRDWLFNKQYGKLGYCKHIKEVLGNETRNNI